MLFSSTVLAYTDAKAILPGPYSKFRPSSNTKQSSKLPYLLTRLKKRQSIIIFILN